MLSYLDSYIYFKYIGAFQLASFLTFKKIYIARHHDQYSRLFLELRPLKIFSSRIVI